VLLPLYCQLHVRVHVLGDLIHELLAYFHPVAVTYIVELCEHVSRVSQTLHCFLELVALRLQLAELEELETLQWVAVRLVDQFIDGHDLRLVFTCLIEVSKTDRQEHRPFEYFFLELV